jgi:hypothetical protein
MFKTGKSNRFAEISQTENVTANLPFDRMERNIVTREEICLDRGDRLRRGEPWN